MSVKSVDHCPVCLVDFEGDEKGVITTCKEAVPASEKREPKWTHRVHKDPCFQNWVNAGHPDCAVCRRQFEAVELTDLGIEPPKEPWVDLGTVCKVAVAVGITLTYIGLMILMYNDCQKDPKFCERVLSERDHW